MANNVYIGNRYVPVFADPVEWDNLRQYEPLTIVTYQGTAYTSRKTVPVGTPLSNTEYWVVTGNYNAQVEQYRQEVVQLESDLATTNTNLANLRTDFDEFEGKIVVCIGDSYLADVAHGGVQNGWGNQLCTMMRKTLNTDFFINGLGGTGFVKTHDSKNFENLLDEVIASLTTAQKNIVGAVIVGGGANDGTYDVTSNVVSFVNKARTAFPNCTVYYGQFSFFVNAASADKLLQEGSLYTSNANAVYLGNLARILTVYKEFYYNNLLDHPTEMGSFALAKAIYSSIKGSYGYATRYREQFGNPSWYVNWITQDRYILSMFGFYNIDLTGVGSMTFNEFQNALHTDDFSNENKMYAKFPNDNYQVFTTEGYLIADGGYVSNVPVIVQLKNKTISYKAIAFNKEKTGYLTASPTKLVVYPWRFEMPINQI